MSRRLEMCKLNNSQGNRQTNWIQKGLAPCYDWSFFTPTPHRKAQHSRAHNGAGSIDEWKLMAICSICVFIGRSALFQAHGEWKYRRPLVGARMNTNRRLTMNRRQGRPGKGRQQSERDESEVSSRFIKINRDDLELSWRGAYVNVLEMVEISLWCC